MAFADVVILESICTSNVGVGKALLLRRHQAFTTRGF
jgi:hypothetical protein